MNHLNTVLLEGVVVKVLKFEEKENGGSIYEFKIESIRYYGNPMEGYKKESSFFKIRSFGREAENCHSHIQVGRRVQSVRIIGRLKNEVVGTGFQTIIVADTIYFEPPLKKDGKLIVKNNDELASY